MKEDNVIASSSSSSENGQQESFGLVLKMLAEQSAQLEDIESRLENIATGTTVVTEWVNRKIAKKEKKRQAKLAKKNKSVTDARGTQKQQKKKTTTRK